MPKEKNLKFDRKILSYAVINSFKKLNPLTLWRNPVIFIVEITAVILTFLLLRSLAVKEYSIFSFNLQITVWLWFTVIFANLAESVAEGRGKAQAMALRKSRKEIIARKLINNEIIEVPSSNLRKNDVVIGKCR